ncbi:MAG: hypothetical protein H0W88_12470 [Parachlamydiaceae bacterium]|nr:hypothetical protein [Parachlamydiaceae bacterium]
MTAVAYAPRTQLPATLHNAVGSHVVAASASAKASTVSSVGQKSIDKFNLSAAAPSLRDLAITLNENILCKTASGKTYKKLIDTISPSMTAFELIDGIFPVYISDIFSPLSSTNLACTVSSFKFADVLTVKNVANSGSLAAICVKKGKLVSLAVSQNKFELFKELSTKDVCFQLFTSSDVVLLCKEPTIRTFSNENQPKNLELALINIINRQKKEMLSFTAHGIKLDFTSLGSKSGFNSLEKKEESKTS